MSLTGPEIGGPSKVGISQADLVVVGSYVPDGATIAIAGFGGRLGRCLGGLLNSGRGGLGGRAQLDRVGRTGGF